MLRMTSWLALAALAIPVALANPAPPKVYYLGTIATDIPAAMIHRVEPLAKHLSVHTGLDIRPRPSPSMSSAIADFGTGTTQIAYLTPVAYLDLRERAKAIPIAIPLTHGKPSFRLAVVVRNDSPVRQLMDLKGRSFAFGDERSLLQRATIESEGLRLEVLGRHAYLKHFDNVAKAVLNRDFDAGIMKETLAVNYAAQGLRIVHLSPPLPTYVIAINEGIPVDKREPLRQALFSLNANNPADAAILTALDPGYTRFVPADDRDFDRARVLLAPYRR